METMQYIIVSSASIGLFYLIYLGIARKEKNFRQLRIYLVSSMLISMLLPLSSFRVELAFFKKETPVSAPTTAVQDYEQSPVIQTVISGQTATTEEKTPINWGKIIKIVYISGVLTLLSKFFFQLLLIVINYFRSNKVKNGRLLFLYNSGFKTTFSFFSWIFIHNSDAEKTDLNKIISHEKIHASQYHSIDLLLIELLGALLWFNPFLWLMRSQIQLVHEYLADEGALSTGIDKLEYQALLVNQVTEERLISLSSSFNHSLIKKRMIMMTKSNFYEKTKLKSLAVVPAAVLLFFIVACVNGQNPSNDEVAVSSPPTKSLQDDQVVASVAPIKMNVMYLAIPNPLSVAVSGVKSSELEVSGTNCNISGSNGMYNVTPKRRGNLMITVEHNGKKIQVTEFRVKMVPNPVVLVAGKKGGDITKEELLEQKEITAQLEKFDFNTDFEIVGFTITTTVQGFQRFAPSKSNKITPEQLNLLRNLNTGQQVYITDVKCIGPEGTERELNPAAFKIQ